MKFFLPPHLPSPSLCSSSPHRLSPFMRWAITSPETTKCQNKTRLDVFSLHNPSHVLKHATHSHLPPPFVSCVYQAPKQKATMHKIPSSPTRDASHINPTTSPHIAAK
ncbi:hypothetical protein FOYG_02509 [Fusarium oxysporum NRRL 32931]|uniref:Uncharacterized protein n=1 Tax=Fusarium oxysporum NRRL 32931 TaxID=660029 RepID=W9IRZ0_FUSOX|nr:hypothetical protein FOYG_02509 [Fusarium oxysporum NRRL 32931]